MNNIKVLPVLPIRGGIIFPHSIVNITVSSERGKVLVEDAIKQGISELFSVGYKSNEKNEELFKVGTIIRIENYSKDEKEDVIKLVVVGLKRGKILKFIQEEPYFKAEIEPIDDIEIIDKEMEILVKSVKDMFVNLMNKMPVRSEKQIKEILNVKSPSILSDVLASFLIEELEEKQKLLETFDVKERLKKILEVIQNQFEMLKVNESIQEKVKEEIEKSQREYFLREQLKVIQKELGISEEQKEIDEIEEKIKLLPDYVQEVAKRELNKLKKLQTISPEYHVVRTYLDWILNLPWNEETEDNLDISHARKVLDEDHYNLEKAKSRILEYLAVKKIKPNAKGAILCFVGPPGVGKTSLGQSIARALNRKFIRISLGGIRDEAEIRGHRRTYVGALPGRIISALRRVKVKNPVIVLDEVDKIGVDFRGDPASALLEVLDPEQNKEFVDHYLEVPFDLSKVLFITTANTTITIPPALLDRMEVIEIPGYTLEEKLKIAKFYLIPREIENHGLNNYKIEFEDKAIEEIINKWTREAGVRQLDRKIAEILRKIAVQVAEKNLKNKKFLIKSTNVSKFLGPPLFYSEVAERQNEIGVAIGLAWTPFGGDIIFIEALKMPGKGQLKLTGHLGNVMKESAQAAYSLLRANFEKWKIKNNDFDKYDVHIHVPAGAIPKDGPSAGIAILMALVSLFSNRPIKKFLAMTGEITLRGKILPVGGIKEKVLAARRAGIKEIILPKWNKKDLEDIPKDVLKDLVFHFVDNVQEAYKISFEFNNKKTL
ncbi:MAG: endopeptidase La [Candidatus Hydrothermia bacterium]|jgi:ATP-dependent Lon protease|nr:endopeptidase La [Candidatus Hydrothermia bacterium]